MGTKYCDHGAYGNYAAIPTWGVPQDGDGTVKTASTAAALASIVFTGIPAGTISVCGVTVSPTWATSADVSANNLATAINAATGNVTTTGFRSAAVRLGNAVFARGPSGGAPSGTCQIMTRHGSATFNGQTAIAHTLTNVDAGASSLTFSGGASGCWGYILSGSAAVQNTWPQAITPTNGGYGLWGQYRPFAGAMDNGDKIILRAKTVDFQYNGYGYTIGFANMGSSSAPIEFVVDDGTEWPADGTTPVLNFNCGSYSIGLFNQAATGFTDQFAVIRGKIYSNGTRNLRFSVGSTFGNGISNNVAVTIIAADFIPLSTGSFYISCGYMSVYPHPLSGTRFIDCRFYVMNKDAWLIYNNQYGNMDLEMENCVIECAPSITTPHVGIIGNHAQSDNGGIALTGVSFKNFVTGSRLFQSSALFPTNSSVVLKDCDLGNITDVGPTLSHSTTNASRFGYTQRYCVGSTITAERDFFFEAQNGLVRWISKRFPPTCFARQLDGVSGYALECVPTTSSSLITAAEPMRTPSMSKVNSLADGARTFTCEIAVDSRLSYTRANVALVVRYIDTSGVLQRITSLDSSGSALTASSATWSAESGGQVVFGANSSTHNKYTLSVASIDGVAADSRIEAQVEFYTAVPDVTHITLVDPEVIIA